MKIKKKLKRFLTKNGVFIFIRFVTYYNFKSRENVIFDNSLYSNLIFALTGVLALNNDFLKLLYTFLKYITLLISYTYFSFNQLN